MCVFQVKTLLALDDRRHGRLLRRVAGRGNIGVWAAVVIVLEEEGLLEQVRIENHIFADCVFRTYKLMLPHLGRFTVGNAFLPDTGSQHPFSGS